MSNEQNIIDNLSEVIRDALEYNYGSDRCGLYHWRLLGNRRYWRNIDRLLGKGVK